ncbi:molybdopterin molybdenumtransferase MoeA [Corynebacterium macginleyi]|uniref:molybdopterin molybdotransferase MoeA n=1 Tax=Corynebacterium macginleyi TaxID=38290 RepID=UPI00190C5A10|nr:molybdopterin molybdotransferase MoeA [Corynebacterium macginleyi]MBK4146700.1 molybdopterin molybdenumtransferase MoeA [Corynebacterium macginleyi]
MSASRSISEHLSAVLALAPAPRAESVPVGPVLHGRVLAEDAIARFPVPPFANSAMDGFLVRATDIAGAGPWRLPVAGDVPAGAAAQDVPAGQAVRIMTGAPVGDTTGLIVIPVENTTVPPGPTDLPGEVTITAAPTKTHIRPVGEDVQPGTVVAPAGTTTDAAVIAALISTGIYTVQAFRRPRIAVISSGNELSAYPDELAAGCLPDSNGPMLACLAHTKSYYHVSDNPAELSRLLDEFSESHDLIITSGGVSAGAFDVVHRVLGTADKSWFGHVHQRPGAPQGISTWRGVPVLALPGNPVAAFVGFQLYARPLIAALSGQSHPRKTVQLRAAVEAPLPSASTHPHIVPVTVSFTGKPTITGALSQGSHRVVSLAGTSGYCIIDGPAPAAGEETTVYLY